MEKNKPKNLGFKGHLNLGFGLKTLGYPGFRDRANPGFKSYSEGNVSCKYDPGDLSLFLSFHTIP